jgi:hypothetical protein
MRLLHYRLPVSVTFAVQDQPAATLIGDGDVERLATGDAQGLAALDVLEFDRLELLQQPVIALFHLPRGQAVGDERRYLLTPNA